MTKSVRMLTKNEDKKNMYVWRKTTSKEKKKLVPAMLLQVRKKDRAREAMKTLPLCIWYACDDIYIYMYVELID